MKRRRNDYFEAKSRFLYIIGFYQHVNSKIELAGKYYEEAVQAFPQNLNAQYGLGQVCIYQKNFAKALKCFETINDNSSEKNEEILKVKNSI
jgi:tetratricopeptide (TPR) repeat protein